MFPENRLMEVLIIGALALIVVGPKDLPVLMRRVGQFVGKMRGMAAEFRASFDELARQSELDDLRKEVEALRRGDTLNVVTDEHVTAAFNDIQQNLSSSLTSSPAADAFQVPVEPEPEAAPVKPKRAPRKPRPKIADAS
jgi:sec-independent protein translocase protein TatB